MRLWKKKIGLMSCTTVHGRHHNLFSLTRNLPINDLLDLSRRHPWGALISGQGRECHKPTISTWILPSLLQDQTIPWDLHQACNLSADRRTLPAGEAERRARRSPGLEAA